MLLYNKTLFGAIDKYDAFYWFIDSEMMGGVSKRGNESPFDIKKVKKWETGRKKNSILIMDGYYFFSTVFHKQRTIIKTQIGKIQKINNIEQIFFFKTFQIQPLLLGIISKPLNIISFFQISRLQQPADHF